MTFASWLRSFPWLFERELQCIISPDLDGVACGLLQGDTLGWRIVGTYDGKALNLWESPRLVAWNEVVFLDMEILRSGVRSIGNHLFALDNADVQLLRQRLPQCANPNLWRGIDVETSFQKKYPFSTLPLLLAARAMADTAFVIRDEWIGLTLHTDSSFTNAATYQANALDWLKVMGQGAPPGLGRYCSALARISAQRAIVMLDMVQSWVSCSGFGGMQRASRFDLRKQKDVMKAVQLIAVVQSATGTTAASIPINQKPVHQETFQTCQLPIHTKAMRIASFGQATTARALSMAATGRSDKGLQFTIPNATSPIALFQ